MGRFGLKPVKARRDDGLSKVAWDRLEGLLAEHYRQAGYRVEHVGTGGSPQRFDGGIDLKLRRDEEFILVQCKHWNAYKVPHNDVHQLLGLMVNEGATGAILVTSGEFTKAAIEAAGRLGHVSLVDGDDLRALLGPLPETETESAPSRMAEFARGLSASPAVQGLAGSMKDRLVDEAVRSVAGRRKRGAAQGALAMGPAPIVAKIVVAVLFLWLASSLFNRLWDSFERSMVPPGQAATPPPLPIPAAEVANVMHEGDGSSGRDSGHTPEAVFHPPTEAEIRESQRKADAAMDILKEHTPEL